MGTGDLPSHFLSRLVSGSPTHKHGSQMRKGRKMQAFHEEITQLVLGVNIEVEHGEQTHVHETNGT